MKSLLTSRHLLAVPLVLILATSASLQAGGGPFGTAVKRALSGTTVQAIEFSAQVLGVCTGIIVAQKLIKMAQGQKPVSTSKTVSTPKPISNKQEQANRQQCSFEASFELNGQKRTFCLGKRQSP